MFNNETHNQHFIAQVEQRLNSIDLTENRKIYMFESTNREKHEYRILHKEGVDIKSNLSMTDLYSLEVFDNKTRDNFERYFGLLENKIRSLTETVLSNSRLEKDILLTLFNAKLMNVIRNPYCIISTLNTYSLFCDYIPTDEYLAQHFNKINTMSINECLLSELCVTEDQYRQWLKIIFYMVVPLRLPDGNSLNFMMEVIKKIFNPENMCISINLATHDNEICLLSDRAHVDLSKALLDNNFGYEFNLTRNAFISFTFVENDLDNLARFINIPENLIAIMKERGISKLEVPSLEINKCVNDDTFFSAYNSRVIYQCHTHFYAANTSFKK